MIKQEIRSLVYGHLLRFEEKERYHPRFIDASIEKTLNEMYWDVFDADPLALQRFIKRYGYTVPLTVSLEGATGIYYTTLPTKIVPFKDKCSGVRRISAPIQGGITFYPMDSREHDLIMAGSYVDTITSKIGFSVVDRIEYYNMSAAIIASGVRADLVIPFSAYADSETVLLPEVWGRGDDAFLDRVLKHLREIPAVDLNENSKEENK